MVAIGDKVTKVSGGPFVNEKGEEVPLGSSLRLLGGFLVRQEIDGMSGYGHPPENFWTVVLTNKQGKVGLLLPEGDEEYRYHTEENVPKPRPCVIMRILK